MALVSTYFSAFLNGRLEASDVYLPLPGAATADLLDMLPNADDYIYLTIRNDVALETVKARNEMGTILLDRGVEGTTAVLHPFGSCVSSVSPTVIAAIKDLVCNYKCCENGDCPCEPVSFSSALLPSANVGKPWAGVVVFSGAQPIHIGLNDAPSWMTAVQKSNTLQLQGTPDAAGSFTFSVSATNCNGTELVSRAVTLIVEI